MKITLPALLLALSLSLCSLPATGQSGPSGQIDLNAVAAAMNTKPTVNINFGPAMMRGFAESMRSSDPQMADMLSGVSGLRLMVYEGIDGARAEPEIGRIVDRLDRDGWSSAVTIEDGDTRILLYLLESDEVINGMTFVLHDGDHTAILANIHGRMDPAWIGEIIGGRRSLKGFGLDGLVGQFQDNKD